MLRIGGYIVAIAATLTATHAQAISSWPQDYPGKPSGDFSPEWQSCSSHHILCIVAVLILMPADYEVIQPMPNLTFPVTRSWAGNIPVDRQGHPNNTLFFWAFEKENGSLTTNSSAEPWGIWLNGG